MNLALALAKKGQGKTRPNPCVGAILVKNKKIVGRGFHKTTGQDHAEIIAIKEAGKLSKGADLYVTLEPCIMCAAAISRSKIKKLYFGADDLKYGAINGSINFFQSKNCNYVPEIYDSISKSECETMINDFFKENR